jgi:methyl-accepting chemotaxis protein
MGPPVDGAVDGVNQVAQTVLGTEVVVLLAAVILVLVVGIAGMLWYFSRAFSKQSDGQIEQIKLFNRALADAGNLNVQLLTANTQNVQILDRIGDEVVRTGDILQKQQMFCNETLTLLQTQSKTIESAISENQQQHGKIDDRVSQMNARMKEIIEAIFVLQNQMSEVHSQVHGLSETDSKNEQAVQQILVELATLNSMMEQIVTMLANQQTDEQKE